LHAYESSTGLGEPWYVPLWQLLQYPWFDLCWASDTPAWQAEQAKAGPPFGLLVLWHAPQLVLPWIAPTVVAG
jgi:hypothetical protein